MNSVLLLVAALGSAAASQQTLDCPLRQIGLDYAQQLQPWRPLAAFQAVADALNGAVEAQNCSVAPTPSRALPGGSSAGGAADARVLSFPLPASGTVLFVDAAAGRVGDAAGTGSRGAPFGSLPRAFAALRALRGASAGAASPRATIVLRAGVHRLASTLELSPADSRVTVQAFPGEAVTISGAKLVTGVAWSPVAPPARAAYEVRPGALQAGFDAAPAGDYTIAAATAMCDAMPLCLGFSFSAPTPTPSGTVTVSFKYNIFWAKGSGAYSYVKNVGYAAGAQPALYSANIGAIVGDADVDSLRLNGVRGIRARYPNVPTAELQGAMQIVANGWTKQAAAPVADYTFSPATPLRNNTAPDGKGVGYFNIFRLGVGGACASRFTPQAAYWCANYTQGGGPGPYSAPVGMTVTNSGDSLPHTPYSSDVSRAHVHSWRAGRWFSWVFGVDGQAFNPATNTTVFSFNRGGNQGSRGGDAGQEMFIENVYDELDAPAEFYYAPSTTTLFVWFNGTAPAATTVEVPVLNVLINATGTQAAPVVDVGFSGITFADSSPNFMGPHGTPSGGDWAVGRSGALFFEGTVGARIDGCVLERLDGNAVFFSGYNRQAVVTRSEFVSIGETAIAQWGYTDGSPVPGMGYDGTAGNQPRGTEVSYNLVHEVGLWTKQNSFYFQSESGSNVLVGNIAYNGPRAGINFDDGFLGNSTITRNVLFNFCRESSDHGPFNSWNRQVYLFDINGVPTVQKMNDTISYNWILANYHSSMAIDNDDGSSEYDTHHNVFISASSGSAYGGNSLKSDFGGHSNYHHDNLDLFWSAGFGICAQLPGFQDAYYGNYLWLGKDGNYGGGQACRGAPDAITKVGGNTVWSPTGAITECGATLAQWQAAGGDPGTVAGPWPTDDTVLTLAKQILGVTA